MLSQTRTEHADVFEVLVPNVLNDDLLVGLDLQIGMIFVNELRTHAKLYMCGLVTDLQHLQNEAEELRGCVLATVSSAHALELDGLLDQALGRQGKAALLPVDGLVYLLPNDVLHKVLRAPESVLSTRRRRSSVDGFAPVDWSHGWCSPPCQSDSP